MSLLSSGVAQFKKEFSDIETNDSKIREFTFVVGGVLVLLGFFAIYRDHIRQSEVLNGIGVTLVVLGVIRPKVIRPLYHLWMGLAVVLGVVVGNILLTFFFFLVVTPMGILKRCFRSVSQDNKESYWLPTSSFKKESFDQSF